MTSRWYGTVGALLAVAAVSGCADGSQVAGTQPPASIAAPTAVSRPSGGPVNVVATAPAPPPRTAMPASPSAPPPSASLPPGPTVAPDPTGAAQSGPPGGDKPGPNGQLYSKHAAQLRVDSQLAAFLLPQGAVRQTGPIPDKVNKERSYLGAQTAAVDTWWTVPGTEATVQAYLVSHPPATFGITVSTPALHGETVLSLSQPQDAKAPQTLFEVGLAQDGDHVDVRVQLQVAYVPTRTAIESIPASVTSGAAVYQPPNQLLPDNAAPAPRRTATLGAADVRVIADAFNERDAQSTGIVHSCPAPDGQEAWFTFAYGGHTVVFHAELNGCGGVLVTADGVPQPELALGETVYTAVEKALHVTKAENPTLP